ncbi:DoxX family membrane protein [Allokutzneria sp. A3M-2-11 16]|uniref:DoxX family protein n=1 Tax=Allokutzneria sp. A3M-2-11 16 TaxID=2962043 RepID=UPI0020B89587|nr:DoxX family membrane protein [Allokutzneria sp. A3M-2-11 16]MCP3799559.1 DoxX family membrane protein [Allokutzneria sp. A3M-2-11 16]
MAPFIALFAGWGLARVAGLLGVDVLDGWQPALRVGLALMFLLTGFAHWSRLRADMIAMVPPRLPNPALLVTVTGVLEIVGAVGLLVPATARAAAICLGLLLLAMFPANVYAAVRRLSFGGRPATPLVPRTVEQVVFLAACVGAAL